MMFRTDDPVADFHSYDAKLQEQLEKLPVCHECGEPIQQEDAVLLDGNYYCDDCLKNMRMTIDID
jgi:formylmethanofuran dehydrogenase subunit E